MHATADVQVQTVAIYYTECSFLDVKDETTRRRFFFCDFSASGNENEI